MKNAAGVAKNTLKPTIGYVTGDLTPEQTTEQQARDAKKAEEVDKYTASESNRVKRTNAVLADKNFVELVRKNSPNVNIDVYLDFINGKKLQTTLSVQEIADIIYDGKIPANLSLPSGVLPPIFINILAKYITGNYGQKKADKDKFFT